MKKEQIDLVKGIFEKEEAKEILLNLIDSKIQFHNKRIFSDRIRFGTENLESISRIKELYKSREQILQLEHNSSLLIHSVISVEAVDQNHLELQESLQKEAEKA